MSKFKVGDVVRYIATDGCSYLSHGEVCTVTSISPCGTYVRVQNRNMGNYHSSFEYINEALPPAPESVQYTELTGSGNPLATLHALQHHLGGGIIVHTQGVIKLTPDEALQLCHDLRRMAMSIKKKEKQDN